MLNLEDRNKVSILSCYSRSDTNTNFGIGAIDIWINPPTSITQNV